MTVRISVTYAATDGRMPENVEIEWSDEPPSDDVVKVVSHLMAVPDRGYSIDLPATARPELYSIPGLAAAVEIPMSTVAHVTRGWLEPYDGESDASVAAPVLEDIVQGRRVVLVDRPDGFGKGWRMVR
jgi:hypothetical protein